MEKVIKPNSGWMFLLFFFATLISGVALLVNHQMAFGIILVVIAVFIAPGFMAIEPNSSRILNLFGTYKGTIKESGFYWTNPFYLRKNISLRGNNLETNHIKVNDKPGNPIVLGAIVTWKVEDTYKAVFEVDKYESFVNTQSEAALRKLAGMYAYDNHEDESAKVTLRDSSDEVNHRLESEISERLSIAGIKIIEARISHLAYSTEIAGAMLQRQQASAIISARSKIVEGAVGMVEMALQQLSGRDIVHLDDDKKAAMVSNLLVVLCGDRNVSPVINSGTLHQ